MLFNLVLFFCRDSVEFIIFIQIFAEPLVETADAAAAKYFKKMLKMKQMRHRMACETLKILASEAVLRRSHLEQEMRSKGYTIPSIPFQHTYSALNTMQFLCSSSSDEEERSVGIYRHLFWSNFRHINHTGYRYCRYLADQSKSEYLY
jgi:hypothetical protein